MTTRSTDQLVQLGVPEAALQPVVPGVPPVKSALPHP
jgi:hypothetical protein